MKTAISLPDDLFRAAERHARRAGKSRSELYAQALSEYLEAMNRVIDRLDRRVDPFVAAAARKVLERTEW
jgi:metal-responsive CopG/Arc/MetJ family transcriptional regulator